MVFFLAWSAIAIKHCLVVFLPYFQITAVAVDPRHQRRGLGAGILLALIQQGRSLGAVKASLEVSATNAAGQGLYAHCGFSTIGRRKGYFANGDDALLQSRAIR